MRSMTCLIGVVILCHGAAVEAGLPHPGTWQKVSDNGNFIFVMISPLPIDEDIRYRRDEDEIRWIRETYSKSGLYRNDGSKTPLWEYDGWFGDEVIIAPDGEHLIHPGGWTRNKHESRAVTFTCRGQNLACYYDVDLIPQWMLKCVLNGSPPSCESASFNPDQMTYTIRTNQGEEFIFDVMTGKIIATRSPFPLIYGVTALFVGGAVALPARWWWQKYRRNRR